ncbi:DNA-binding transcriptional MocR family regulator [Ruminiclostridium sufflavum DSM 19573]|uniref:DNA-binding transcriptional MocR family regulator n=1 Tax=Ruminiclostridium sufflavum DSM 19573 TaxID=1121337 RepID=A0A318XK14_9FIRM|nr:PLP-dependent aminotransferase family protein [Ruminiclostridium sufflavum]PYG86876.1 DNA-binding transcriptional MocR family regulator [Ruminiclostridium sufflavum DSM 19573]
MINVSIQLTESARPKYLQLFDCLKELIAAGQIKPGEKLPAIRSFAQRLGVNNVTVINAYKQLENNKYITAKKGSGYYVSGSRLQKEEIYSSSDIGIADNEPIINFASATPHPSVFPVESFKECINEVIERDKGFAFGYQDSKGFKPLRKSILNYLDKRYSIKMENEDNIQIVSGAQQGIDLIGKVLLNPGDYVITENPTYDGATEVFKSRGARVVRVKLEKDGIDLVDLEKKIRICKPKLLYVMTSFQNPTTISYSRQKLRELLELAKAYNTFIVEDDSMSDLCYEDTSPQTLKALDDNNAYVIYLKSFSKILMPGLRAGCMVIPDLLINDFAKIKNTSDISSSGLIQRSLDMYFDSGKWDEHHQYMIEIYKGKYEFMLSRLEKLCKRGISFDRPKGGLYFWIKVPKYLSAKNIYDDCKKNGLLLLPSGIFYDINNENRDSYIRLSFASSGIEQIREGMIILENALFNNQ